MSKSLNLRRARSKTRAKIHQAARDGRKMVATRLERAPSVGGYVQVTGRRNGHIERVFVPDAVLEDRRW